MRTELELFNAFNSNILEAVGKCGGEDELKLLSEISTYRSSDSMLLLGRANGIYQLMLKGVQSDQGTNAMAAQLLNKTNPESVRILCANYFYRNRSADLSELSYSFRKVLEEDSNPYIRMGVSTALARSANALSFAFLLRFLDDEPDERVKINLIRGLSLNPSPIVEGLFQE